jgi:hypothetical protein
MPVVAIEDTELPADGELTAQAAERMRALIEAELAAGAG